MAGRLYGRAKIRAILLPIAHVGRGPGLTALGLEPGRSSSVVTTAHGVNFRSYLFSSRGESESISSQQEKAAKSRYGGILVDAKRMLLSPHTYVELSNSKLWPNTWIKSLAGSLQQHHDVQEFVNFERSREKTLRSAHTSIGQDRRPLHKSSRRENKSGDKPSVLDAGVKYNVIRIDSEGSLQPLVLKSSELGLHPRDLDLLSNSTFIPQRATIAVQRDKVVVRMESVRAIVFKDHVLLFDARRPSTGGAFAKSLAQQARENPSDLLDPMPFHLRMMESLLEETSNFFHQKVDRLKLVVERILEELTEDVSMGGLQKLLPLRRAVTEIEHDVRDTHEAMDQVLRSDDILQALCLVNAEKRPGSFAGVGNPSDSRANFQGPHVTVERDEYIYRLRQAAADMLLTYQREVDDAGGVLEELRKGMEAAQEVWELGLDATRNRIIRMNLYITMSTCSLAVATLPAAFFGMNLPSGFEEHPTLFYWVVAAASAAPLAICVGLVLTFRVLPRRADKRRAQELAGLLDLLRHLDSIDEIMETVAHEVAGKAITRQEFQKILRAHPSAQFMRQGDECKDENPSSPKTKRSTVV